MQTSPAPTGATTDTGADPFSAVEAITTAHLTMIAVLAVIVVIAMLYGARLKHRRTLARKEEQQRLDAYDDEHPDAPAVETPPRRPAAPGDPVTTASGQEEPHPPVATPHAPPPDPADRRLPPASAAAPASDAAPAPIADDAPVAAANASAANGPITQLKGLGPKVAARLAELGITGVGQLAALDDDAADALDAQLGAFRGRMARDRWVEQARFLAAGDRAGFEAVFGRL